MKAAALSLFETHKEQPVSISHPHLSSGHVPLSPRAATLPLINIYITLHTALVPQSPPAIQLQESSLLVYLHIRASFRKRPLSGAYTYTRRT